MKEIARRTGGPLVTAVFLSLVLAGQALAAGWSAPTALTSGSKASTGGLVTLGTSTAIAVYANNARVVVRRSTNSGASWSAPLRLSDNGHTPAIAGRGTRVDVVWLEGNRVRHARSTNSGASFGSSVALSPSGTNVMEPTVGRGANGLVVVAWMEAKNVPCCDGPWAIRARVSTNGGSSFGAAQTMGTGWEPAAAAGKGVAYVAYEGIGGSDRGLHIRRTVDGGATWKPAVQMPWPGDTLVIPRGLSITAAGRFAYVAYHDLDAAEAETPGGEGSFTMWVRYHRTTSKGKAWSVARDLTPPSEPSETDPVIALQGGVVRAAYSRFVDGRSGVYYRQSSDGKSWGAEEQVSQVAGQEAFAIGVGHAGRPIVLYTVEDYSGFGPYRKDVFVRHRTP